MAYEYQFPEANAFRAKEVTEPEFPIQSRQDWFDKLWVDFSPVRSTSQFDRMTYALGIIEGRVQELPNSYQKFIFSGHRGSGKSVELKRFSDMINGPEKLLSIFVDLEQETAVEQLVPEDIFVILIAILSRELQKRGIKFDKGDFELIASEWVAETEVEKELRNELGVQVEAGVKAGWSFWNFLGLEGNLKGAYARQNTTTKTIREKIRANPKSLIGKLNALLVQVRSAVKKKNQGQDIVFIVDGLEKAPRSFYESLFINDPSLITDIRAHIISTVPIATFYEIQHRPSLDFFEMFYLPMLRINAQSIPLFHKLIDNRVAEGLIPREVLDRFITLSGGCPRILLKLVNRGLLHALGKPLTLQIAEETEREESIERWRALTQRHRDILAGGKFDTADSETLELLQSLSILEYNGSNPERKINPLLQRFILSQT